jgi:CheY-like chemotaxis protein
VRGCLEATARAFSGESRTASPDTAALGSFPALILLDLMMAVVKRFGLLLELHANPSWRATPVVVSTAPHLASEDRRILSAAPHPPHRIRPSF